MSEAAPVHVVVATSLIPRTVVSRLAGIVPAGVGVEHVPLPWDDQFGSVPVTDAWREHLARAHVLVGFPQQVEGLLKAAPELRWVQYYGAGYERAPLDALREVGVGLVSAAGAGADGVAEFAVMAMLALARRAPERLAAQQRHEWQRLSTRELAGRRATVVGAGEIGTRLCRICDALGLEVVCVRRNPASGAPTGARRVHGPDELTAVLADTDVLLLAAALTEETKPLGAAAFDALPPDALLVNVGRGGLIDHDALLRALAGGRLGGVWLDVHPEEPLPPEHPLWVAPRTVLSAHDATATESYPWNVAHMTAKNVRKWLAGEPVPHTVLPLGPPPAPLR